ncbi:cytochrome c biogenesis protein CcdA [Salinimicrobium sp. TIG7-5_MAKvit]|uniref:protein-disulfide reductase DsbD family protein n=1 Tax=Salinimicrobium sp. TIG7-5_MAKvit TaxID=3121289 RepID=UPI003C6E58A5
MKRLLFIIFLVSLSSQGQIYDPVQWTTSVEKVGKQEYSLITEAIIEEGWHLYSQKVPEDGPIPTQFTFKESPVFELLEGIQESEGVTEMDPVFKLEITYFESKAVFIQRVKVSGALPLRIKAKVEFMVCDAERCLPPITLPLEFIIVGPGGEAAILPAAISTDDSEEHAGKETVTSGSVEKIQTRDRDFFSIFVIAFFSGFAALLTPCVFPMLPLTVSYFTKQSKSRVKGISNAVIYGISIIVIYVLLGTLVTVLFGADSLNALSTNPWFNFIFFLLLVVFALSFLGAFELVLPASWGNKIDSKADKGGYIGIFFMALALAIVSFSCTGPIVGTLLVEAASKGGLAPVVGMAGFALAIALPFAIFAAFPGWMNSLPKSGGWLNTVKVFLGFLELALAFKFLSNADLVLQLHLLKREVFLAIWIAIFGALGLYLFGRIKLSHDAPSNAISVSRLSLGLLVITFTIYLIPGLWGAPLKLISGFPPPMNYSESPNGFGVAITGAEGVLETGLPEGAKFGPHNIVSFLDYKTGLAYAQKVGKPVLLDFTGHACVNCRKMEERVWSEPEVLEILKNEVVLISLYVDDKRELPENEQYVSETTGREIKSIGNKWSDFQIRHYQANAQPYYVLLDSEGNQLNEPSAYEPNIETYRLWLEEGLGSQE